MSIILYHGTNAKYADDIKREGLRPHAKPGNDASWKAASHWDSPQRRQSVYVTPDLMVALEFAMRNADENGGEPAVVTLTLPDAEVANLARDEAGGDDSFLRHKGAIAPEFISQIVT